MRLRVGEVCLVLAMVGVGSVLLPAQEDEAAKANALWSAGKRLEALPLYEDLAKVHPSEWSYQERLAVALGVQAEQLSDPVEIRAVRVKERDAAKHAIDAGDPNYFMHITASIDPDAPIPAVVAGSAQELFQAGERAYGVGDYATAMTKYAAAADADPQMYEASLYAGDTAYTQKDLKSAAAWFARAISVDPTRETAYRYWGDAILKYGNDPQAAKEKYIDAILADPYNKLSWQGISNWAHIEKAVLLAPKIERPAAPVVDAKNPTTTNIQIDIGSLDEKKNPDGFAWMMYSMIRGTYHGDAFKQNFPNEKEYRHTLKEEDAALGAVAATVKEKNVDRGKLDESLRNLVDLNDAGMLDCWILINGADRGIAQDYATYREEHRQLLHDYLSRYVIHGGAI